MKRSFLIILLLLFTVLNTNAQQTASDPLSQRYTIDIAPTSLIEAIGIIRAKTGIRFLYSPSSLPKDQLMQISAENETLAIILEDLLQPLNIEYELIGDQIALRWVPPKQRVAFTQTIRGRVIDLDTRHPLIGAEVRGVELNKPLDNTTFQELHALWMQHLQSWNYVRLLRHNLPLV